MRLRCQLFDVALTSTLQLFELAPLATASTPSYGLGTSSTIPHDQHGVMRSTAPTA